MIWKATLIFDKKILAKREKYKYFKSHEEINEAISHGSNIGKIAWKILRSFKLNEAVNCQRESIESELKLRVRFQRVVYACL